MIFRENRLLADDSHEISYLIFAKTRKDVAKLSSAAVVIGVLSVKSSTILLFTINKHSNVDICNDWIHA